MSLQIFTHMLIADGNGYSTSTFDRFMGDFSQQLQSSLSDEGNALPTLTTAQIAQLNPANSVNRMLINSDTNELIVNLGGTFKTVQTS